MNSLSIILNDGHVYAVDSVNDRFKIIHVKGEKRIPLAQDSTDWYLSELLNNLGLDDFREWAVAIIYGPTEAHLLHPLLISLIPQNPRKLEVRDLEAILPELLLKRGSITLGHTSDVAIGKTCWRVAISESGEVTDLYPIDSKNPDFLLAEHEIPAAFRANYSFTTDRKELNRIETQLADMENLWIESKKQIEVIQNNLSHALKNNVLHILNYKKEKEKCIELEESIVKLCSCITNIYRANIYRANNYRANNFCSKFFNSAIRLSSNDMRDTDFLDEVEKLIAQANNEFVIETFFINITKESEPLLGEVIIQLFLKNKMCPEKVLKTLHTHKDWRIRKLVAEHQNCSIELLQNLLDDTSIKVSQAAYRRIQMIEGIQSNL